MAYFTYWPICSTYQVGGFVMWNYVIIKSRIDEVCYSGLVSQPSFIKEDIHTYVQINLYTVIAVLAVL